MEKNPKPKRKPAPSPDVNASAFAAMRRATGDSPVGTPNDSKKRRS